MSMRGGDILSYACIRNMELPYSTPDKRIKEEATC
jgi:hypothetical protein